MSKVVKITDIVAFCDARNLLSSAKFESILEKQVKVTTKGTILWGDIAFEAVETDISTLDDGRKTTLSERFESLYDRKKHEDNSWSVFLEGIVTTFYKEYALLIYEPITGKDDKSRYIQNLATALKVLTGKPNASYNVVATKGVAEKICIATVKLKIDLGGAPIPAIVPFYFKVKDEGGLYLEALPKGRAEALHRQIKNLADKEKDGENKQKTAAQFDSDYAALVVSAKNALSNTLNQKDGDGFWDSLILTDEAKERVADFIRQNQKVSSTATLSVPIGEMSDDEVLESAKGIDLEVSVSGALLRYLAILDCYSPAYAVYDKEDTAQKKLYDVTFDLLWNADVRCARCHELLVKDSVVDVDGEKIVLDLAKSNPIDDVSIKFIETHSTPFKKHVQNKRCEWHGGHCEEVVCEKDLVRCGFCEKEKFRFCKNCTRPEMVFCVEEGGKSVPYHTKHLVFVHDMFTLLPPKQTEKCTVCGRVYSKSALGGGVCGFCAPMVNGEQSPFYQALFKGHRMMLPYFKRFGKKKICNEDDQIILFRVGKKLYLLNKENIADGKTIRLNIVDRSGVKEGVKNGETK